MMSYQRAYLQWYVGRNRKKILLAVAFLLVSTTIPVWNNAPKDQTDMLVGVAYYTFLLNALGALILPVLQFRYLMNQRAGDLYLPLPIPRKHLFFMQFGIGTILLALPNLVYGIAVLGSPAGRFYWKALTFLMLLVLFFSILLYSINTFLVLQCHNLMDAFFAVFGALLAQFLIIATIEGLLSNAVSAILPGGGSAYEFFPMGYFMNLSPVISAIRGIDAVHMMVSDGEMLFGYAKWVEYSEITPLLLIIDGLLIIAVVYFAKRAYEMRKGESSEQKTTSKWIYPLLITVVSGCLVFENILSLNYFIFTVILYFIMNFVAQRKIAVHPQMVIRFVVLVIAALGISRLLVDTNGFGLVHDVYEREELQRVYMDISFFENEDTQQTGDTENHTYLMMNDLYQDEWLLDHIYELQKGLSKDSDYNENMIAAVNIHYELIDQTLIYRHYLVDEAYLEQLKEISDYITEHDYTNKEMIEY